MEIEKLSDACNICKLKSSEAQWCSQKLGYISLKAWESGVPRAGKDWCTSSSTQVESEFNFLYLLVLFRPSTDWMIAIHIGEDYLLYSFHQLKG